VLSVPQLRLNWQTYYEFAKPLAFRRLKASAIAHYEIRNNKANPNPASKCDGVSDLQEMHIRDLPYTVD